MAWMNMTISLAIPPGASLLSCLVAIALAIAIQTLEPLVPGLAIFQSYVEWSIASKALAALNSLQMTSLLVVASSGLLFFALNHVVQSKNSFYREMQTISAIMFANAAVSHVMHVLMTSPTSSNIGIVAVALSAGISLSNAMTNIFSSVASRQQAM